MQLKKVFLVAILTICCCLAFSQDKKRLWTDSVFRTLSLSEKISQLWMIPVSADMSQKDKDDLFDQLREIPVGGLLITGGGPYAVAGLKNRIQRVIKVPLFLAVHAGRGPGQTIDSTMLYPAPLALAALRNDSLIRHLGSVIGKQLKTAGFQINFMPTEGNARRDISYENYFGDDPLKAGQKNKLLIDGMQGQHILVCTTDFTNAINPLTPKPSPPGELRITDIRELKKLAGKKKKGQLELLALTTGNDIQVAPENMDAALRVIQKSIKKNKSQMAMLDASVMKILEAKFDAGLSADLRIDTDNLYAKLHSVGAMLFDRRLKQGVVTVVRNSFSAIPVQQLEDKKFACIVVGVPVTNPFFHYLEKYSGFTKYSVQAQADTTGLEKKLLDADVIVLAIFNNRESLQTQMLPSLQRLGKNRKVIICHFGDPAGLRNFTGFPTLLAAYSDNPELQQITAQVIFGGISADGILPVAISTDLPRQSGVVTRAMDRLSYDLPEAVGMDGKTLEQIRSIAQEAIDMKATPGCQVLVARHGKIIYDKSFGYLTYDKTSPVNDETIYDLASVTKVSATLQTVMFMYEKGLIDVNRKLSYYLPELRKSNKKDFLIKDILTHQAGLWPFLPFWAQTVKDTVQLPEYYSRTGSAEYPYPVAANLYAARSMKDSLWSWIIHSKIVDKSSRTPYDYRYSDMGFYMMMHLAEKMLNQPMEEFLGQNFYEVLGASTTGYLPLLKFPAARIAPTENDRLFRRSQLVGYVHDQGAAMHGGVAGHAGLFSTIDDLAKLGQMWLQKGSYGGHRFFKPETIEYFTQKQYENSRRGLGWDKPVVSDPNGPTSAYASAKTFGHTGFTGISIWVDPEFDLLFIFFSNRVYPEMTNNKILNANIRPRVQDVVYRSIFNYCSNQ